MGPHRRQPTRLPRPWDSPGKNTGVGCHFLLQGMKVKSENEVAQSCLTLSDPMDCSLPGSCDPGIFQARVLEWDAIAFSICIPLSSSKEGISCSSLGGHRDDLTYRIICSNTGNSRHSVPAQTPPYATSDFPGFRCLPV